MTSPSITPGAHEAPGLLAVALDGAGWHPAAWREPDARPRDLTSLAYWRRLAATAEDAGVDLLTLEDAFGAPRVGPPVRLDALLVASALGPLTKRIGLAPVVTATHTEPFHVATGVQTLDHVSRGRAGWQVRVSPGRDDEALTGRRDVAVDEPRSDDGATRDRVRTLFDEAADVVEVARRLWDSWEDDAIIRDVATGRFLDRARIHPARFTGATFSVEGASIVPRSPQGQPLVTALAHARVPFEFAAGSADVVFTTPADDADAIGILEELREAEERVGRAGRLDEPLRRVADLVVVLDGRPGEAARALARLDDRAGAPLRSDAQVFAGTPDELVDLVRRRRDQGYDGVRLRPARLPADLVAIAEHVAPALAGPPREGATLRERLGLGRPASRYAAPRTEVAA